MAKKKKIEPDEDLDDEFSDLEEDSFEDEEIKDFYPEIKKKSSKEQVEPKEFFKEPSDISEEDYEEELELELEKKIEFPDFKYVKLIIHKGSAENDYELDIMGQSHGFCNIFVKHLLDLEGVNIAAYKITYIDPSKIYIRLENGYKIKDILYKASERLREEVVAVQKLFKKLM